MVSSFLSIPLKHPEARKEWEANVTQPPDWQRLEIEDAALAPTLKEILQDMGHP
jgi:hypothetical protein